ncbi:D-xylose ABC transporter ATP-binding protein [Boudabousia marimammalium]|uniref:D-xylose ABC transporter ATP-binding protein n=1 Tax=Boudabousia marimammalium TaxID=156892 RepID=A0A1Q5PSY8_9ACTO|nr:D-xylose ABC transporter ATP-binding protein [Boudabousia marimammalium]
MLELNNVSKTFPGVKALDGVSLTLREGEVLGLCGENGAGKSTLMKILSGIYTPDSGAEIVVNGQKVDIKDINDARALGISIIHQELNLVPDLTVAQNLFMGRDEFRSGPFIKDGLMCEKAEELFSRLGMQISPKAHCRDLSVAQQQMVEIARSLSFDAKILIMDEPTAALTVKESQALFELIKEFVGPGKGLIYISHRMPEIEQITDRVSVIRDGQYVGTRVTAETPMSEIVAMMVGRKLKTDARPEPREEIGEEIVRVAGLSTHRLLRDVSFDLRAGEILGFAGLMGAGRTEVARCLIGADPRSAGEVYIRGKKTKIHSVADAVKHGLAYLSEDRKQQGLCLQQDIVFNTCLSSFQDLSKFGVINDKAAEARSLELVEQLRTKTPSVKTVVNSLSGGNQQKVVIAKWLLKDTDVLIFDEPTRGVDVGAKEEIYGLLEELRKSGKAIMVISSELPEVLRVSDRIAVMSEGHLVKIVKNQDATQENLMELATTFVPEELS